MKRAGKKDKRANLTRLVREGGGKNNQAIGGGKEKLRLNFASYIENERKKRGRNIRKRKEVEKRTR